MSPADPTATTEALELLERLRALHGPLVLLVSGGCCEGSAPMCLRADEPAIASADILLGEVGGTPVYVDGEQYRRWREPSIRIGVGAGPSDTFSLEGPLGVHLTLAPDAENYVGVSVEAADAARPACCENHGVAAIQPVAPTWHDQER